MNNVSAENDLIIYKYIFDNVMDIILIIDDNGKILNANKQALETYRYTYEEFTSLHIYSIQDQNGTNNADEQL